MFKTKFDKWLDNYECDLAVAFDNQTEYDNFNQFIKSEYKTMLENERERACEAHEGVFVFNVTK